MKGNSLRRNSLSSKANRGQIFAKSFGRNAKKAMSKLIPAQGTSDEGYLYPESGSLKAYPKPSFYLLSDFSSRRNVSRVNFMLCRLLGCIFHRIFIQGRYQLCLRRGGGRKTKIFRRKHHQQQQQQQQLYRSNSAVTKIWPHFAIQR